MNRLSHHIVVGWLYVLQALKSRLEYKFDFLLECAAALLLQVAGLATLWFQLREFHSMNEWSASDALFIYGFAILPRAFFDAFAMSFYMFSDRYIVNGELDRLLLRPLGALFQLLMEGISFDFLADLTLGIVVLSYAWSQAGPQVTPGHIVMLALAVFGAWGVLTGVFLALTSLSFWSPDRMSILPPVYNLLNFAQYPLNIFVPPVRILLTFLIPFGFVAFYPAAQFLKPGADFHLYSLAVPLVGILCLALGVSVWMLGVRKYSGAGS